MTFFSREVISSISVNLENRKNVQCGSCNYGDALWVSGALLADKKQGVNQIG
jgi:hypothetical protein